MEQPEGPSIADAETREVVPDHRLVPLVAARFAVSPADAPESPFGLPETADTATIERMLAHRTCRHFDSTPLADELVDLLLSAALSTPSKSDFQQCSIVVVDDPSVRSAIAELLPTMPWVATAPRFFVFCGDSRRIRRIAAGAGVEFANDHLDAFLNAAADAAMHLSTFVWAAESLGLGTCPISVVRNHIDEVSDLLGLPDHVFPFAGLCLGRPERFEPLSPRLPQAVTVHHDRYDDHDTAGLIADYDRRRLDARPRDGVWSTTKAAMVGRTERSQLARFLRGKGFGLG